MPRCRAESPRHRPARRVSLRVCPEGLPGFRGQRSRRQLEAGLSIDIAFNNAGTPGEAGPSTDVSEGGWNDAIATNLTGSFLGAKHQIAEMIKHGAGSVIFTSTFVGYSFAFPGLAAYAASKSGLIGLTQALAAEFGPHGIRVNAILPGGVETDMFRTVNDTPDKQAFITNLHALKRVAQPEELARSVLYLASDDASFVTGTASLIDGGGSITRT
jgi:NAD(P)-dependent dehydrogenase (short-subunit alcohol dehydrogenase family)